MTTPAPATTTDLRDEVLLTNVYRAVARWPNFEHVRDYEDDLGRYAFLVRTDRAYHICAARKQLHAGQYASFMEREIVERCLGVERDTEAPYRLTLFVGTPPTLDSAWVFHPLTVRTVADPFETTSKKGGKVDALQLEADRWGELLGDYVTKRVRELPMPDDCGPRETTLSTYEVSQT